MRARIARSGTLLPRDGRAAPLRAAGQARDGGTRLAPAPGMHVGAPPDWTRAWRAAGLALTAWPKASRLFAQPRAARLVELALELVVLRHGLVLRGYVILPSSLHVVTGRAPDEADALPWPTALGRVKGTFARWWGDTSGRPGPAWRQATRVKPLATEADVRAAVARCHRAPVEAGLATTPAEHAASSWHGLHGRPRRPFVSWGPTRDQRPR